MAVNSSLVQGDDGPVACPAAVPVCFLCRRRWLVGGLFLLFVVALFHSALLRAAAWPLVATRPVERPNYLWLRGVVDGFESAEIYARAAELLREDPALRVVVVGREPTALMREGVQPLPPEFARRELLRRQARAAKIEVVPGMARDDRETMRLLSVWLTAHPDVRLITPCKRLRTGELCGEIARECLPDAAGRIGVDPVAEEGVDETNWWRSRLGGKIFLQAWLRRVFGLIRDDVDRPRLAAPSDYEAAFLEQMRRGP